MKIKVKLSDKTKQELKGIPGIKGDKGNKGDVGPKGLDGKDGKQGLMGMIGKDGKIGKQGLKGDRGLRGFKGDVGNDGKDGEDGSPDTPKEIKVKLESLQGNERLDASAIKNLTNLIVSTGERKIFTSKDADKIYLKLDQTNPQTISGGIPLLTGLTPTSNYQIATKKYVDDSIATGTNYWSKSGTVLSTATANDKVRLGVGSTTIFPNTQLIVSHSTVNTVNTLPNIGIVGEAASDSGLGASGVRGYAKSSSSGGAVGVMGISMSGGDAFNGWVYGGMFSATGTSAGNNYGIFASASGGANNYSFYGSTGSIYNADEIITAKYLRIGTTTDTTNGNIRYTGTDFEGRLGGAWVSLTGSMVYPGAGIAVSTGAAWAASIADNSANWNTAFGWGNHAGLYLKLDSEGTDVTNGTFDLTTTGNITANNVSGINTGDQVGDGVTITGAGTIADPFVSTVGGGNVTTVGGTSTYLTKFTGATSVGDSNISDDGSDITLGLPTHLLADNRKIYFGTGDDCSIYYDGTNMLVNPKEVGSGYLGVLGNLRVDYHSAFGANSTIDVVSGSAGNIIIGVEEWITDITQDSFGVSVSLVADPTANTATAYNGGVFEARSEATNTKDFSNIINGIEGRATHQGSGNLAVLAGGHIRTENAGIGGVDFMLGLGAELYNSNASGTVTDAMTFWAIAPTNAGTITNVYGLYIEDHSGIGGTLSENIHSVGVNSLNVFEGNVDLATISVSSVAGIDATVTYVDTLLGAKTLTFSKGILVSQV